MSVHSWIFKEAHQHIRFCAVLLIMYPQIVCRCFACGHINHNRIEPIELNTLAVILTEQKRLSMLYEKCLAFLRCLLRKYFESSIVKDVTVLVYLNE